MTQKRCRSNFWLIILATVCLVGFIQPAQARSKCDHVEGRFEGVFEFTSFDPVTNAPLTGAAHGTITGDLAGIFSAVYFNFEFKSNGDIALNGSHTFIGGNPAEGNGLFTFDDILLSPDPTTPNKVLANALLQVVGGTGIYKKGKKGATGLLHSGDGGVDFNNQPPGVGVLS